ncbi:MAG: transaldolase family protein [Candidatus Lokiarchaeota archaeon]|nr:transaldolase family protein [Candidatus Lokiarchaeota archaeon]
MTSQEYKSKLHEMVVKFPGTTDFWNDSCSMKELKDAVDQGAVGATSNPVIVGQVLKKEMTDWAGRIDQLIKENPEATEVDITWKVNEEMAAKAAKLLEPAFTHYKGKKGRLSIQTNPKNWRNTKALVEQAVHFNTLAPNMQVKIPVTKAGVAAIEEATYQGVSINATVCFSVPQAIAVAEAVERGLKRREAEKKGVAEMSPVCTIMVGRVDDWLKVVANKENIITDPSYLEWAGVAVMKKAYKVYKDRRYRTRLLAAACRNHFHWSEFIGADMVITITAQWQNRYNDSDVEVASRIYHPVDQRAIDELTKKFKDFKRAYDEDGMKVEEFDSFGPNVRTLRGFIKGYEELMGMIRDRMLPDPDK